MAWMNSGATSVDGLPFTDALRELLADARGESERLQHDYIGCEHVVLALTGPSADPAVLARLGIDGERIHASLEATVRPGRAGLRTEAEYPYTSRTIKSFSLAAESARTLGHTRIDVEHLLLGMLREGMNIGSEVLQRHGLTAERVVARLQRPDADADAS